MIHPVLIAAFPVLFLWAHNLTENVTWADVRTWLLGTVLIAAVLWAIGTLIFRSAAKAGLAVSIFVLMFFSYGYVSHLVETWHLGGVRIGANRYLMPVWALLTLGGIYLAIRGGKWLAGLTSGLNIVAAGLVLLNVGQIVLFQFGPASETARFIAQGEVKLPASLAVDAARPSPGRLLHRPGRVRRGEDAQRRVRIRQLAVHELVVQQGFLRGARQRDQLSAHRTGGRVVDEHAVPELPDRSAWAPTRATPPRSRR